MNEVRLYENINGSVICNVCSEKFDKFTDFDEHCVKYHVNECYSCKLCKSLFSNAKAYYSHPKKCTKKPQQ